MKRYNKIIMLVIIFTLISSIAFSASTKINSDYINAFYTFMGNMYYRDISTNDLVGGSFNGILQDDSKYSCYEQIRQSSDLSLNSFGASFEKIRAGLLVNNVYPGTNAAKLGLQVGDIVYRIDRISTSILNACDFDYTVNTLGGTCEIEVIKKDTGKSEKLQITLKKGYLSAVDFFINDDIGYIRINQYIDATSDDIKRALTWFDNNNIKNIILDLREQISMNIDEASQVANYFLPYGRIASGKDITYAATNKRNYHHVNIIINKNTIGAGEVIARAIKNYGTGVVYGETSYGVVKLVKVYPVFSDDSFVYYSHLAHSDSIEFIVKYLKANNIEIKEGAIVGYLNIVEADIVDNKNIDFKKGVVPDYEIDAQKNTILVNPQSNGIWIRKDYVQGDLSYDIFVAEKILKEMGFFTEKPDVIFDKNTLSAINNYKQSINLKADGILDKTTQNILNYSLFKEYVLKDPGLTKVIKAIKEK